MVAISALFHPMNTLPAGGAWFSSSSVKSPFPLVALTVAPIVMGVPGPSQLPLEVV